MVTGKSSRELEQTCHLYTERTLSMVPSKKCPPRGGLGGGGMQLLAPIIIGKNVPGNLPVAEQNTWNLKRHRAVKLFLNVICQYIFVNLY